MTNRTKNSNKNLFKTIGGNRYYQATVTFIRYLFLPVLGVYLLLLLIDAIFPDSISRYVNLDYLLIPAIFTGIIAVLTGFKKERSPEERRMVKGDIIPVICFGIIGAVIVWYQTRDAGWLTYVISPVSGMIIVLLTMVIWQNPEEENGEDNNIPDN
jgi:magnesium-transporting ATPase (P-type)